MAVAPAIWCLSFFGIGLFILFDVFAQRRLRTKPLVTALLTSAGWLVVAAGFGVGILVFRGSGSGVQFFSGYLLELALSVDNVFVFALMFRSFGVPAEFQRRVLTFGVLGAVVLRGGFVAAGGALVDNVSWSFYVFGSFLVVTGVRMASESVHVEPERNRVLRIVSRVVPVTSTFSGDRFFVRDAGHVMATRLFAALVAIETTDIVFATDSIPAIFGITRDLFLVATSNALAVMGLRSLYFLLAEGIVRFRFLGKGVAALLVLIGVKMLFAQVVTVPVGANLGAIVVVLGMSVWASLIADRRDPRESTNTST